MEYQDFTYVGKVTKTFGYKGELVIFFENDNFDEDQLEAIFIEIDNKLIPFNIEGQKKRKSSSSIAIAFFELNSEEDASLLVNNNVFLPDTILLDENDIGLMRQRLIGFKVLDSDNNEIGVVKDILEYPGQELLEVLNGKIEILIPFREEYISSFDDESQIISMDLPDGLIDLQE